MRSSFTFRLWLLACLLCAILVILSIKYVDRPVADYVHAHLLQSQTFEAFGTALDVLSLAAVFAFAFLLACGCWVLAGRRLGLWTPTPLLCSWALVWSLATAEGLKRVFGRAQVEMWTGFTPGDTHLGIYGFHWFHGIATWQSFPSGTAAAGASLLSVLWIQMPRWRSVWVSLMSFVVFTIIVTNSHFVADVLAGAFLGASIGWMTVRLLRPIPSPH